MFLYFKIQAATAYILISCNKNLSSFSQELSKLMNGDPSSRWGNEFGVLLLPVYYHTGDSNPLEFVKRSKAMIDKKKLSLEAPFSYKLMQLIISLLGPKVVLHSTPNTVACMHALLTQ